MDAFVDFGVIPQTGDNTLLATLSFAADSVGNDVVSLLGDSFNFGGIFFLDANNGFVPFDEEIDSSFSINVVDTTNSVTTPGSLTLMLFAIGGLLVVRKKS